MGRKKAQGGRIGITGCPVLWDVLYNGQDSKRKRTEAEAEETRDGAPGRGFEGESRPWLEPRDGAAPDNAPRARGRIGAVSGWPGGTDEAPTHGRGRQALAREERTHLLCRSQAWVALRAASGIRPRREPYLPA